MNTEYEIPEGARRKESVVALVRGIFHDLRTLSTKEFTAAKLEMGEEISKAVNSSIFLGIGLFILGIGIALLSIALAMLLASYLSLPIWAGLGIVGSFYILVGVLFTLIGKKKIGQTKPIPKVTLRSAQEDARYIRETIARH